MDLQVTCPICLNILYRPVILPCKHEFCNECIKNALDQTAYCCPLCRYRLSNWLRRVKDTELLIDKDRENVLRDYFPSYFRERDLGMSPKLSKVEEHLLRDMTTGKLEHIPESGGIYEEYLKEAERLLHLRAIEDRKNEEASLALCRQMLAEDTLLSFDTDVSSSVAVSADVHNTMKKVQAETSKSHENLKKGRQIQLSLPKLVSDKSLSKTRLNSKNLDANTTKLTSNKINPPREPTCHNLRPNTGETKPSEAPEKIRAKRVKCKTSTAEHKSRLRSGALTKRDSLLEYAVAKRALRDESDGHDETMDLMANDEKFARDLQKMYLKLPHPNSPMLARIRPRCKKQ